MAPVPEEVTCDMKFTGTVGAISKLRFVDATVSVIFSGNPLVHYLFNEIIRKELYSQASLLPGDFIDYTSCREGLVS